MLLLDERDDVVVAGRERMTVRPAYRRPMTRLSIDLSSPLIVRVETALTRSVTSKVTPRLPIAAPGLDWTVYGSKRAFWMSIPVQLKASTELKRAQMCTHGIRVR